MTDTIWRWTHGEGPIVATAIHDGHEVRPELLPQMAISEADRLREEDPFTADWVKLAPTQIVGLRSRFEVDLNRSRDQAVYRTPEDAWGLTVWNGVLPEEQAAESLAEYDLFYNALGELYRDLERRHGRFVVFDLHTYNHRRNGPDGPAEDPMGNPQVNVGTGTMRDRDTWASVIDRFISDLAAFPFPGGTLDVRENIRFRGGNCGRWAHQTFPTAACVLSVEVKKFFMDEWTGVPDNALADAVGVALKSTVPGVLEELKAMR